jgi:hypothetical protein
MQTRVLVSRTQSSADAFPDLQSDDFVFDVMIKLNARAESLKNIVFTLTQNKKRLVSYRNFCVKLENYFIISCIATVMCTDGDWEKVWL